MTFLAPNVLQRDGCGFGVSPLTVRSFDIRAPETEETRLTSGQER